MWGSWCCKLHLHSIIHTEIANKLQQCIKIYYSMFIRGPTCFGRHTAHHQELRTALAASGFAYVRDCWTLRLLDSVQQPQRPTTEFPRRLQYGRSPHAYVNQRLQIQLELRMMSGVPLETCWAFNERWNNKFCYKVASCWLFLLTVAVGTLHEVCLISFMVLICTFFGLKYGTLHIWQGFLSGGWQYWSNLRELPTEALSSALSP